MSKSTRSILWRSLCALSAPATAFAGGPTSGTLYYTTYSGTPNVHKVDYTYDGSSSFVLATPVDIATTDGADGIVFNPLTGNIVIGGQGPRVHEITTAGAAVTTVNPNTDAYHLSVDPSNTRIWAAGIPAGLSELPLSSTITTGIPYTLSGLDTTVDTLAWRGGTVLYTSSGGGENGYWGTISLNTVAHTATTTRLGSMPATHGLSYDPFTDDFIFIGDDEITQVDGTTLTPISTLVVPGAHFDQGTVDGLGHGFFADNNGDLVFLDFSNTYLVGAPGNFLASPFLANFLDDVAPLIGPGGSNTSNPVPEAGTVAAGAGIAALAGVVVRRRMRTASR